MSTDEYVPSDEQIRDEWISAMTTEDPDNYWDAITDEEARARWSRWLAAHDARVRRDAEAELDSWMARAYEAEKRAWQAEKRIKAVRDVHWADKALDGHACAEDGHDWPCPTIRALEG